MPDRISDIAGMAFLGLAFIMFVLGTILPHEASSPIRKSMRNLYRSWNDPVNSIWVVMISGALSGLRKLSWVMFLVSFLSGLLGIWWINNFIRIAYSIAGNSAAHLEIAADVSQFKAVYLWCLLAAMIISLLVVVYIFARAERAGERGPSDFDRRVANVGTWAFILAASVPSIYGVYFLFTSYFQILNDLTVNGLAKFAVAQLFLLPINTLILSIPASLAAFAIVRIFRVFSTVDLDGILTAIRDSITEQKAIALTEENSAAQNRAANRLAISRSYTSGISLSFAVTALAAAIGMSVEPESEFRLSSQILLINSVFDGLTLVLTMSLFIWALSGVGRALGVRTVYGFLINLVVGFIFAVASLYLSLLGTGNQITLSESILRFFGQAPEGASSLGPYFFIMQTTWIPLTVLWSGILLLGFVARAIAEYLLMPLVQKGKEERKNPEFSYIAAQCSTCGFTLLGGGLVIGS